MIKENYKGYLITANPVRASSGKWAITTIIEKDSGEVQKTKLFYADDKIHYILKIEAAKECINLGKNLINSNMVGF
jgi:hypothetical protein